MTAPHPHHGNSMRMRDNHSQEGSQGWISRKYKAGRLQAQSAYDGIKRWQLSTHRQGSIVERIATNVGPTESFNPGLNKLHSLAVSLQIVGTLYRPEKSGFTSKSPLEQSGLFQRMHLFGVCVYTEMEEVEAGALPPYPWIYRIGFSERVMPGAEGLSNKGKIVVPARHHSLAKPHEPLRELSSIFLSRA